MKRYIVAIAIMLAVIAGIVIGTLVNNATATAPTDGLAVERKLVESWNQFAASLEAQTALLKDLNDDYMAHNPMRTTYPPDIRKAQRVRRVTTWDAVIREQENQLSLMKAMRQAEGAY
jgi:hypothetical protein